MIFWGGAVAVFLPEKMDCPMRTAIGPQDQVAPSASRSDRTEKCHWRLMGENAR